MTIRLFRSVTLVACFFCTLIATSQNRPIGVWRSLLPYNTARGVASDGQTLYAISEKAFFTWNTSTLEVSTYSKVEGMHEIGTAAIAHDIATGTTIIGYENSNIDLFRHNNFIPIPYIKLKSFSGSKTINNIYALNGVAYVSTGLGIVVIDLDSAEVRETYVFNKGGQTVTINAFTSDSTSFYAATSAGLYKISRSNPTPQAFSAWQLVDSNRAYTHLTTVQNNLYVAGRDTVYRLTGGVLQRVYSQDSFSVTHLDGGSSTLYVSMFNTYHGAGRIYHLSLANDVDSTWLGIPRQVTETGGGKVWIADQYQGLGERETFRNIHWVLPEGPNDPDNTGLYAHNGEVWVAHGGANTTFFGALGKRVGISQFKDEHWKTYNAYNYDLFRDSVYDFMDVMKDERTGTVYAGTYHSGLFELKPDGTGRMIKQGQLYPEILANPNDYSALSSAIDANGNLVVTQANTTYELAVRDADGNWNHYNLSPDAPGVPGRNFRLGSGLIIDDLNQKWFYSAQGGGVVVYNDNNTPGNTNDDSWTRLANGERLGNLPSSSAHALAKDRDGAIWIGTDAGIGIINCPAGAIDRSCEAEQRIVQYDQFAGRLFSTESVRAIAVDGANRKWIGTTNGVWLLSPDANKVIYRFNTDNSPLPSNTIQKIAVDGVTGDVYIGTDQGLISFRSTATDGGSTNGTVQVFPNPVPSGYSGQIAIRGLVTDADVRITDIAGQLIYRTKALGGQAVWNGLDYTGKRPQTGILLIFITNKDGLQTSVGKMMFMN